jgi:hypothetical protein
VHAKHKSGLDGAWPRAPSQPPHHQVPKANETAPPRSSVSGCLLIPTNALEAHILKTDPQDHPRPRAHTSISPRHWTQKREPTRDVPIAGQRGAQAGGSVARDPTRWPERHHGKFAAHGPRQGDTFPPSPARHGRAPSGTNSSPSPERKKKKQRKGDRPTARATGASTRETLSAAGRSVRAWTATLPKPPKHRQVPARAGASYICDGIQETKQASQQ